MSINLSTSFADLGKLFAAIANLDGEAGSVAPSSTSYWGTSSNPVVKAAGTMYSDILTRLQGSGLTGLIPGSAALPAINNLDQTIQNVKQGAQTDSQSVVITRVNNDVPQAQATSLTLALIEWIRQMKAQSVTVNQCTVSTTVTAGGSNTGNATVVAATTDPNGLLLEYVFNESILLKCTQDQYHGATAGQEQLTITAPAAQQTVLSHSWPAGSGVNTTTNVIDPNQSNGAANNQLNNSAFKTFSGNVPANWTVDVGGSQIQDGTSNNYAGAAHCLEFIGDGATLTSIYQPFANSGGSGGSTVTLSPATVYLFNAYVKLSAASPAAGVLTFSLTDGNGNVLNNNNGVAQTITYTLTGVSNTNYNAVSGAFETPTVMPSTGVRLRIKLTTALSAGKNVFIDYAALAKPAQTGSYGGLYAGGPYVAVFRGSVDLINYQPAPLLGDVWTLAVSNNYGGDDRLNFQTCFNRLFGMAGLGLILPSASGGGSTISDSLIS